MSTPGTAQNLIKPLEFIFLTIALFLFIQPNSRAEEPLPPWTPPHILWEIDQASKETSLWPAVQSYGYNLKQLLVQAYVYHYIRAIAPPAQAAILAENSGRAMDFFFDWNSSSGPEDAAAKTFFSNLDLLPEFSTLSWFTRRALTLIYSVSGDISRIIPWPEFTYRAKPSRVYFHDKTLNSQVEILWIPETIATQYGGAFANQGFFIVTPKYSATACLHSSAESSIAALIPQLSCMAGNSGNPQIHIYPIHGTTGNQLLLRPFSRNSPGPFYLSPLDYGDSDTAFITDRDAGQTHWEEPSDCQSGSLNSTLFDESFPDEFSRLRMVNPLDENTWQLLLQLITLHLEAPVSFASEAIPEEAIPEEAIPEEAIPEEAIPEEAIPEEAIPEEAIPEEAIAGAYYLSTPAAAANLSTIISPAISETLIALPASNDAILIKDIGGQQGITPVFSIYVATAIPPPTQEQLLLIEQMRPGLSHNLRKLSFDIIHQSAAQLLTSQLVSPAINKLMNHFFDFNPDQFTTQKYHTDPPPQDGIGERSSNQPGKPVQDSGSDSGSSQDDPDQHTGTPPADQSETNQPPAANNGHPPAGSDGEDTSSDEPYSDEPYSDEPYSDETYIGSSSESSDAEDHVVKYRHLKSGDRYPTVKDHPLDSVEKCLQKRTAFNIANRANRKQAAPLDTSLFGTSSDEASSDEAGSDTTYSSTGSENSDFEGHAAKYQQLGSGDRSPTVKNHQLEFGAQSHTAKGHAAKGHAAKGRNLDLIKERLQKRITSGIANQRERNMAKHFGISFTPKPPMIQNPEQMEVDLPASDTPASTTPPEIPLSFKPATPPAAETLPATSPLELTETVVPVETDAIGLPLKIPDTIMTVRISRWPDDQNELKLPAEQSALLGLIVLAEGDTHIAITPAKTEADLEPQQTYGRRNTRSMTLQASEEAPEATLPTTGKRTRKRTKSTIPVTVSGDVQRITRSTSSKQNMPAAPPKKTKRSKKTSYTCPVQECSKADSTRPFASPEEWWKHLVSKHIANAYFDEANSDVMRIGHRVTFNQQDFNCRIGQCPETFDTAGLLSRHLKDIHNDVIDLTPFNPYWQGKSKALAAKLEMEIPEGSFTPDSTYQCKAGSCQDFPTDIIHKGDQPFWMSMMAHRKTEHPDISLPGFFPGMVLSQEVAHNLNKPYLTRHGDGFHCHNCGDSLEYSSNPQIKQTPEGLGRHWQDRHMYKNFMCPARGCNEGEHSRRLEATTAKNMYQHMLTHKSAFLAAEPGAKTGWLLDLDIFPFDINPTRKIPEHQ